MSAGREILTADDVAGELKISRRQAYLVMRRIPHLRVGRLVRVRREVFDSFRHTGHVELVYFASSGAAGPIKIGRARNLKERMMRLQIGNPERLSLLGYVFGGLLAERRLHAAFEHLHLRGEWFRRAPELLEYVETHGRS